MLDGVRASQIGIDFTLCVTDDEGKLQVIPLKEPNTMVTSANQKEYV